MGLVTWKSHLAAAGRGSLYQLSPQGREGGIYAEIWAWAGESRPLSLEQVGVLEEQKGETMWPGYSKQKASEEGRSRGPIRSCLNRSR